MQPTVSTLTACILKFTNASPPLALSLVPCTTMEAHHISQAVLEAFTFLSSKWLEAQITDYTSRNNSYSLFFSFSENDRTLAIERSLKTLRASSNSSISIWLYYVPCIPLVFTNDVLAFFIYQLYMHIPSSGGFHTLKTSSQFTRNRIYGLETTFLIPTTGNTFPSVMSGLYGSTTRNVLQHKSNDYSLKTFQLFWGFWSHSKINRISIRNFCIFSSKPFGLCRQCIWTFYSIQLRRFRAHTSHFTLIHLLKLVHFSAILLLLKDLNSRRICPFRIGFCRGFVLKLRSAACTSKSQTLQSFLCSLICSSRFE